MLGSQTSLLKPQPVTKSLHMNRDITVCESQKGSSANSIFCCLTCPCCQWTTVTLSKAKNSEMKMTRDMAINVAEKNIRNIWAHDHAGPTSHPGSILSESHPLEPWTSPRAGKPSLFGFYRSTATSSPSGTIHTCSQAAMAELSAWWEHWVPQGPKCLPSDPSQSLLTSEVELGISAWSHIPPCFFLSF